MPDFQKATQAHYLGKHGNKTIYAGNVDSDYIAFHGHPQGGYLSAILMDAIHHASKRRVVALNAFFFKPAVMGPCLVELEDLKTSDRGYCVTQAIIKQLRTPAPLTSIEEYDPAQYISKLHTVITTTNKKGGYTSNDINNQPTPPVFDQMKLCSFDLFREGKKVLKMYENVDQGIPGEAWNAYEWTNGEPIDAKSIACFADMASIPKALARNKDIFRMPRLTLKYDATFHPLPTTPIKRVLGKVVMTDIIESALFGDLYLFDQDGHLLVTARHHITFAEEKMRNKKSKI